MAASRSRMHQILCRILGGSLPDMPRVFRMRVHPRSRRKQDDADVAWPTRFTGVLAAGRGQQHVNAEHPGNDRENLAPTHAAHQENKFREQNPDVVNGQCDSEASPSDHVTRSRRTSEPHPPAVLSPPPNCNHQTKATQTAANPASVIRWAMERSCTSYNLPGTRIPLRSEYALCWGDPHPDCVSDGCRMRHPRTRFFEVSRRVRLLHARFFACGGDRRRLTSISGAGPGLATR